MGRQSSADGVELRDRYLLKKEDVQHVRDFLDREELIAQLCMLLQQGVSRSVCLALFSVLASYSVLPLPLCQQVQDTLQTYLQQAQSIPGHKRQLIGMIEQKIQSSRSPNGVPIHQAQLPDADTRALALESLKQQSRLTKMQVEEILSACTDQRTALEQAYLLKTGYRRPYNETVQGIAWQLLSLQVPLEEDAQQSILRALESPDTCICAAASVLLQRNQFLLSKIRKAGARKIMGMLKNDEQSHRILNIPRYRNWQLDEILFDTLSRIAK